MIAQLGAKLRRWRLRAAVQRSALFDGAWYLRRYPDLLPGCDAALHYLANGAAEGRDPGPEFSTSGYVLQCQEAGLAIGTDNPLLHYHRVGAAQGMAGCPSFAGQPAPPGCPVILFVGHQAQRRLFGAERSLLHMLERATAAGLCVEVVLPQVLNADYLAQLRARAHRIHLRPFGWRHGHQPAEAAAVAALMALIVQSGAVELHQNTVALDAPLLAARRLGIPAVLHLRELPAEDPELCARLALTASELRMRLLAEADRFVANSVAVARWIAPPETARCLVLPNSIDAELFTLPFQPQTPLRVGLISSNVAKKGLSDMLRVAQLWADLPSGSASGYGPVVFRLIGPPSADLAALSPLPESVQAIGYFASPVQALAELDVVLSLSHFAESFGRTVYEALAAGRPVICYDRGTPPALVGVSGAGGAGLVVPADDPAAVVQALLWLTATPGRLLAASDAARRRGQDIRGQAAQIGDRMLYAAAFP